jgi:hypothetical protein
VTKTQKLGLRTIRPQRIYGLVALPEMLSDRVGPGG